MAGGIGTTSAHALNGRGCSTRGCGLAEVSRDDRLVQQGLMTCADGGAVLRKSPV